MINELEGSEDEHEAEVGEVEAGVNDIDNQIDDGQDMEGNDLPIWNYNYYNIFYKQLTQNIFYSEFFIKNRSEITKNC